jgi:hypothetical protein
LPFAADESSQLRDVSFLAPKEFAAENNRNAIIAILRKYFPECIVFIIFTPVYLN